LLAANSAINWRGFPVPLDWATTQMNLGNALFRLGERESVTARLEEAIAAYKGALEIFSISHSDYYKTICSSNRERALALIEDRRKWQRSARWTVS
jgi:tetratricopeptide (TPR) repeat protein